MARLPRLTVAGFAHLVMLRGNDSRHVFADDADRAYFLQKLLQHLLPLQVQLHAYVLLTSEVRLLVTPSGAQSLPNFMQSLGREYVRYFNSRHGRSGTLWEGRYRSTLLQTQNYMLSCMVALDNSAVAADLAAQASQYSWSSCAIYGGMRFDMNITMPQEYWALGDTPFARQAAYLALVKSGLSTGQAQIIEDCLRKGWALGDQSFIEQMQRKIGRRLAPAKAGRPRKNNRDRDSKGL